MEFRVTADKKKELETELAERKQILRVEIGERVATARAFGDLSENAEYHAARNEQAKNESRILEIEHILKHVEIISRSGSGIVELGATVVIKKDGDDEKTFMIVSDTEADIAQNKLSTSSPMGSAMMGKKSGDTFETTTPRGTVEYVIVTVS